MKEVDLSEPLNRTFSRRPRETGEKLQEVCGQIMENEGLGLDSSKITPTWFIRTFKSCIEEGVFPA